MRRTLDTFDGVSIIWLVLVCTQMTSCMETTVADLTSSHGVGAGGGATLDLWDENIGEQAGEFCSIFQILDYMYLINARPYTIFCVFISFFFFFLEKISFDFFFTHLYTVFLFFFFFFRCFFFLKEFNFGYSS